MNYEFLHLWSLMNTVKILGRARRANNHRLSLFAKSNISFGRLPLHVHILGLQENLFVIDISCLDFLIERCRSVLAGHTGQRLSLISEDPSLPMGLAKSLGNLTGSSS